MTRRLRLLLVGVILLLPAGNVPAASANDVSGDEFVSLVTAAIDNPAVRRELAQVTSVDGEPVDMATILDGGSEDVRSRLEALSRIAAGQVEHDGSTLRGQANEILSKPPFSAEATSEFTLLGRIATFITGIFNSTGGRVLGVTVIVILGFAAISVGLSRFASRPRVSGDDAASAPPTTRDYRAQADSAAASGDYATAVRLLFVDGTRHLEQLDVIRDADTTSAATVRPLTTDTHFLDRFDEIAYGGADAHNDDVTEARRGWDTLTERVKSR